MDTGMGSRHLAHFFIDKTHNTKYFFKGGIHNSSPGRYQAGSPAGIPLPGPGNECATEIRCGTGGLKGTSKEWAPDDITSRFAAGFPYRKIIVLGQPNGPRSELSGPGDQVPGSCLWQSTVADGERRKNHC